jgi:two-component system sensor kinase FixL
VFGYTAEETIGRSADLLVPPDRTQEAHSAFEGAMAGRAVAPFETVRLRKDGSPLDVSISDSPIRDARAKIIGISSTQRDITAHKHAELETERLNQELSHVARVTMMGELTSSLAHELNQPLTAILSNAQAAQRLLGDSQPDLEELREILADIVADDDRAGEIIQRLRTLLRKGELEFRDLDVNALVLDVARLVRSDAIIKSISVTLDLASDLPRVRADRVQLQQVILNLMLNAIDAVMSRPATDRKLLIRTGAGTDGTVNVAVRDSGPGIPPDKLERIFEPFFTTKASGMGMGLAIARTILHSHGGRLWAENAPGGGVAFTLALPAMR